jgi:hypothetical protein
MATVADLPSPSGADARLPGWLMWAGAILALAVAQILFAGYQFGAGNQAVQIPFLLKSADPSLFARDAMVDRTIAHYPSWFFRGLGSLIGTGEVQSWYFALHVLTAAATLAAAYALSWSMFQDRASSAVAILLLLPAHHRALGGDGLYSAAFTHTWAALPVAILALALLYRERWLPAAALAGALFNVHALTAGYLGVMIACVLIGQRPWRGWARLVAVAGVFIACAAPTALAIVGQSEGFGQMWLAVTRARSAAHVLPSTWWGAANPDLPRFGMLLAMGVLAMSYAPAGARQRTTWLILLATAVLFVAGYVLGELLPVPPIVRAQLFRSSRLLLVILLVQIAHAVAQGLKAPSNKAIGPESRLLEFVGAITVLVSLAVPPLLLFLPVAMAWWVVVALTNGRLSVVQASFAGAAGLVTALAHGLIAFPVPGLRTRPGLAPLGAWLGAGAMLAIGAGLLAICRLRMGRWLGWSGGVLALLAAGAMAWVVHSHVAVPPDDPWVRVQLWARDRTPPDSLFLTPIRPGGFRIHSRRSVVGEWRDGTQAFFAAGFAPVWWERMEQLQAGLRYDTSGAQAISPGKPLGECEDWELIHLARTYGATHIVLPHGRQRELVRVYDDGSQWAIYLPRPAWSRTPDQWLADTIREGARDAWASVRHTLAGAAWGRFSEKFQDYLMEELCQRNIERYRRSAARVQIVDAMDRPMSDLAFEVRQTRQDFGFSCSLPFFAQPAATTVGGDFRPPPVTPAELDRFSEVFNFSLIPFSGKWMYIEPAEGERHYEDLDKYVDWCAQRGVEMEFHFLSGYHPAWLRRKPAAEQAAAYLDHSLDLVRRYGDRIRYWQVVNETMLLQHSPQVFREIRRIAPHLKLGVSHCAKFWSPRAGLSRRQDMLMGLEDVRELKRQGVQLDFFGFHGHRPFGLWASVQEMYAALDAFAAEGVKLHITEFTCPLDGQVVGPVKQGTWTSELQARWYERLYTVCFSHPAVEMINLWGIGPVTWQEGSGLLDEAYQPKPVFHALRELVRKRFRTQLAGRTGDDGAIAFYGFHGDYELVVTLPSGDTARTKFSLAPGRDTVLRLRLDTRQGKLTW